MSDRKTERLVSELLKGDISPEKEARVKAFLRKKGADDKRLTEYEDLWKALAEEDVPEPSEAMHLRFRKTLEEAKKQSWRAESASPTRKNPRFRLGGVPQWAFGFSLIVIGWFIGFQLTPRPERAQIQDLNARVNDLKTAVLLTKLESVSAPERMKAVQNAENTTAWDDPVRNALIQTLNRDPNANVRLAAMEALARRADEPGVRDALIQSIDNQDSPLLQLALADVMVALNEKRAAEPFRKIIADPSVYFSIRRKLEETVRKLL